MVTVLNAGATSYVLTNLKKYTRYEFFLVPFYKTIEGRPSNVKLVTTLEDVPTGAPENVHVGMINMTSAFVRWSPPPKNTQNGQLIGYKVRVAVNLLSEYLASSDLSISHCRFRIRLMQIQIKSNSSNKILGQMSLNASTMSVIINSLTTGGLYTARVAGQTRIGLGPFSSPTLLNMDPGQLAQLPPRTDPSHGGASVVRETWFLVLIITMIFTVIAALLAALYVRRRQAMSKQLGHLNVPVGTANDICQLNKDTLWLERGWRPTNTLQAANDKDCETKLLNNQHMLAAGIMGMAGSEYAEVNLTTFYNTRKQMQAPPPEPYATTTLCVGSRNSDSIETSCQKSNSSDSCLKPDYSSLDSNQEPNKSTVSPSSDNVSGGDAAYADENLDVQRRQYRIAGDAPQTGMPMPNWCDMLPPPPEHPPPLGTSIAPGRMHQQQHQLQHSHQQQQQQVPFSPHLGKRSVQNDLDHCGGSGAGSCNPQSPPTPPIRVTNSFSPSPTPWSGGGQSQHSEPGNLQVPQGRYTTLPPQTNPPPLPSFPQGFNHYDYKNQENEYESGSVIYGHHQNGLPDDYGARVDPAFARPNNQQSHLTPSAVSEELYRHRDEMFHNDNLYQPENDEWDRKSCDSNTHSDACCSCSESSCLYADTVQYNAQQYGTACGHSNSRTGSRSRSNRSPRRRNRTSSPTYSSDSNYSCIPQRQCGSTNSQERLRHNRSKGNQSTRKI